MTTTDKHPVETFYDVPSWYERPAIPKGQVGFGIIPPKRAHTHHHGKHKVVEGRSTSAGAGILVMFIIFLIALVTATLTPSLLTDGLAFFGLN